MKSRGAIPSMLALALALTACGDESFRTIESQINETQQYEVKIQTGAVGETGSQTVWVLAEDLDAGLVTVDWKFDLMNDGAELSSSNLDLTVTFDEAMVCARGSGQENTLYTFQLSSPFPPDESIGC